MRIRNRVSISKGWMIREEPVTHMNEHRDVSVNKDGKPIVQGALTKGAPGRRDEGLTANDHETPEH